VQAKVRPISGRIEGGSAECVQAGEADPPLCPHGHQQMEREERARALEVEPCAYSRGRTCGSFATVADEALGLGPAR